MRAQMIDHQLRARGIKDPSVLLTMSALPRERFVPAGKCDLAYEDGPLDIGDAQTISQPYIVAYMTELLELRQTDNVLEIGTGSGYQTAVLAGLCHHVYTVEKISSFTESAKSRLSGLPYRNISFLCDDGWLGWPKFAPYQKIIVTAASAEIPPRLIEQLSEGGRMVLPVGAADEIQRLVVGVKKNGLLETSDSISVRFVPLVHE
jgi:protein-L-isoaspartate(D-aspartate) O-methyltransferase